MVAIRNCGPLDRSRAPWQDHYPADVPLHLDYPAQPLGWLLEQAASRFPDRISCHYYSQQITYAELLSQARRLKAVLLRAGLAPGDRVAVLLPNLPEYLVTLFGTWMAGGVVVALSPLMVEEEVVRLVKATGCRAVVTLDVLSPLLGDREQWPELVLLTTLSTRLSRLERFGYAWVRLRKIGFHHACNGTTIREFQKTIDEAEEDLQPVA